MKTENRYINELYKVVLSNYENPDFNVQLLCEINGESKSTLFRNIKKLTKKTPHRFIEDVRFEQAVELVRESGYSIKDAAYTVGYSDPQYFSKRFKLRFGFCPRVYKKRCV